MTITIRYFASLRDSHGDAEQTIATDKISTVADIMAMQSVPLPESTLVAVNQEYAYPDTAVKSGDEVAFFPPVTGG